MIISQTIHLLSVKARFQQLRKTFSKNDEAVFLWYRVSLLLTRYQENGTGFHAFSSRRPFWESRDQWIYQAGIPSGRKSESVLLARQYGKWGRPALVSFFKFTILEL